MLIDTNITIAYKCPSCGTFEFFNTSLFNFLYKKEYFLPCRCKKSSISIAEATSGYYSISTPCIGCGSMHISNISKKELFSKNVKILYCPEIGMQICFIGNDEEVRNKIDNLEKEFDELINRLGYDNYFKNTQVMLDSLNRIHDIAEQGNLFCECGNNDIELILFSDKINLKCKKCPGSQMILAGSNGDLKDILKRKQILLSKDKSGYDMRNFKSFIMKTDGK